MTETIGENIQTKRLVNQEMQFMGIVAKMEELDVFNTKAMTDVIDFKWDSYGMRAHLVGCIMHLAQIGILVFYIDFIYINNYLCDS